VGAEHCADIIKAIVTKFGERKIRGTLENFNRNCNYLLYYGIQTS
jgi:small nuclear ribonucleoprotein (snRNP)-like protein